LEELHTIAQKLDVLIELSIPPPKPERSKLTKLEQTVYALCDLQHDRKEMARLLNKSPNLVSVTIDALKKKGLVKSVTAAGRTRYLRLKG
jgi:DNA-binding MarR family transcriptional regulator